MEWLEEKKSSVVNLLAVVGYVFQESKVLAGALGGTQLMTGTKLNK